MPERFVVTGCGRSGTKYVAELLTAAGIPCGHEKAFSAQHCGRWQGRRADSSWMAATMLESVDVPVVLLVRHPLRVVASWVEIGFFSEVDAANPTHQPLREFAPEVYEYEQPHDRALAMWLRLTTATLGRAELVLRLEQLDATALGRLLRWAGGDPDRAQTAHRRTGRVNRHEAMRQATGVTHDPDWRAHGRDLIVEARRLARLLGYNPDEVPNG